MTRTINGRTFVARHTVPVRNWGCNVDFGLRERDARDQAAEEARDIRKSGRAARVIRNADGFGVWEEIR